MARVEGLFLSSLPGPDGGLPVNHLRLAYHPALRLVEVAEAGGIDVVLALAAVAVHLFDRWFLETPFDGGYTLSLNKYIIINNIFWGLTRRRRQRR